MFIFALYDRFRIRQSILLLFVEITDVGPFHQHAESAISENSAEETLALSNRNRESTKLGLLMGTALLGASLTTAQTARAQSAPNPPTAASAADTAQTAKAKKSAPNPAAAASAAGTAKTAKAQSAPNPAPAAAASDTAVEEVVITAERRSTSAQKTAGSVTVRDGDSLREQGKVSAQQILQDVVGVTLTPAVQAASQFNAGADNIGNSIAIRGIKASDSVQAISAPPTTAVYVDGVYEGMGSNFDVDRVEVLRGPQGTLYGRSATAGVVAFHTKDPELDGLTGDALAEVGSYGLQHYSAAVNVPVGEKFAFRVAADHYQRNGFDDTQGGKQITNAGRIKALWEPTSKLKITAGFEGQNSDINTGGDTYVLTAPNSYKKVSGLPVGTVRNETTQAWLNVDWDLGFGILSYLPSYRHFTQHGTMIGLGPDNTGKSAVAPSYNNLSTPENNTVTHELRLHAKPDSLIQWQAGTFWYRNDVHTIESLSIPGFPVNPLNSSDTSRTTRDQGYFGEATIPLNQRLRLTGGLRYDVTSVDTTETFTNLSQGGLPSSLPSNCAFAAPYVKCSLVSPDGKSTFRNWTYKTRLEYDLTKENMLYGMVSTGFVPGDVQIVNDTQGIPHAVRYSEEKLTAFEVGSKNRFLDNTLQVNADAFYYEYGGYQMLVNYPTGGPNPGSRIINEPARVLGAELETTWRITPRDRFQLAYSYSHATFHREAGDGLSQLEQLTGSTLADTHHVPGIIPQQLTASLEHKFDAPRGSTFIARVQGRFQSGYTLGGYTTNINAPFFNGGSVAAGSHVGPQATMDLNFTWLSASHAYSVSAYVNNVTNNRYKTSVNYLTTGAGYPNGYPAVTLSDPITVGVVFQAHM
ncbi:TonB-dependent receptor [Burkholderia sp. MR1-5-21]